MSLKELLCHDVCIVGEPSMSLKYLSAIFIGVMLIFLAGCGKNLGHSKCSLDSLELTDDGGVAVFEGVRHEYILE